jgi:hypothetical protein
VRATLAICESRWGRSRAEPSPRPT